MVSWFQPIRVRVIWKRYYKRYYTKTLHQLTLFISFRQIFALHAIMFMDLFVANGLIMIIIFIEDINFTDK